MAAERKTDPKSLGAELRRVRENLGMTLEEVHKNTRIPLSHLDGLERGSSAPFPAPVYVRGALQTYCEVLDLAFEDFTGLLPGADAAPSIAPPPTQEEREAREGVGMDYEDSRRGPAGSPALIAGGAGVLLLIVLGGYFAARGKPDAGPKPAASTHEASVPDDFKKSAPELVLELSYANPNWVKIIQDGIVQFEGKVPAGHKQTYTAKEHVVFRFETEEGVTVTLDGSATPLTALEKTKRGDYTAKVAR